MTLSKTAAWWLLLAPSVAAQDPVRIDTITGETALADEVAMEGDTVRWRDGGGAWQERSLPEVASLEFTDRATDSPLAPMLWLWSGTALPARFLAAAGTNARFALPLGAAEPVEIALPWRAVRAVRFDAPGPIEPEFAARLREPPAQQDTLYGRQPDGGLQRVSLAVRGVEDGRLLVHFGGADRTIPLDRVYGVVFGEQSGAAPDRQPNPRATVVSTGGIALEGRLQQLSEQVVVRLDEGVELSLPRAAVARVIVSSDKVLYLSALQPRAEQTPALDRVWPWWVDRRPDGSALQLDGKRYATGLVLVPRTRLHFALPRPFELFEATIGMDDRAGPLAHAVFRVFGDGAVLYDSGPIGYGDPPRPVRLPVDGVRELALEADFGDNLDLGDLCAFAAARVVNP